MTDSDLQQKRLIAAAIDIGIGFALGMGLGVLFFVVSLIIAGTSGHDSVLGIWVPRVLHFVASLVSLAYILGRDLLGNGRSLGKKTQDIRVVTTSGAPISLMDSVKRNAIFGVGGVLALISSTLRLVPCIGDVVACLLSPLVLIGIMTAVVAAVVEIIKITTDPAGIRIGDQMAGTRVVR